LVDGLYDSKLVVSDGLVTAEASVQIAVGNAPPLVTIAQPAQGQIFSLPSVLDLSGSGADPDNDSLSYAWTVDLYHDIHIHPGVANFVGQEAQFPVDDDHGDGDLTYYRIQLTATDAGG